MKDLEAAERVAIRLTSNSPRGHCLLAEILAQRGRNDEAVAQVEAAAKAGDTVAAANVAINLAAKPNADKRWIDLAGKILAADAAPSASATDLMMEAAMVRHIKGDFAAEVAVYQKMLESRPTSYLFLNNMAWTLSEELNKPQDGLKRINEAIDRVGALPQLLDTRGGDPHPAEQAGRRRRRTWRRAAEGHGKDSTVEFHLSRAYLKLGKADDARAPPRPAAS